ncbi:hypothetical protein, partial [Endozoicomonas elysicola]|uniref:hypothetical protein n=1 Tax=Endozoicomonas elysicola TaxID=305900 RepID=UPI0012F7B7A2
MISKLIENTDKKIEINSQCRKLSIALNDLMEKRFFIRRVRMDQLGGFHNPLITTTPSQQVHPAPPPSQKALYKGMDTEVTSGKQIISGLSTPSREIPTETPQTRAAQIFKPQESYTIRAGHEGGQTEKITITPEIHETRAALSERLSKKYGERLELSRAEWVSVDEDTQQKPATTYTLRASRGEEEPERKRDASLETQQRQRAFDDKISISVGHKVELQHASWEAGKETSPLRIAQPLAEKTTERETDATIQLDHHTILDKAKEQIQKARVDLENKQKLLSTMSHGDISTVNRQTEETPVDEATPASLQKTIPSAKSTDSQSHSFRELREQADQQVKEGLAELTKFKAELQALKGTGGAEIHRAKLDFPPLQSAPTIFKESGLKLGDTDGTLSTGRQLPTNLPPAPSDRPLDDGTTLHDDDDRQLSDTEEQLSTRDRQSPSQLPPAPGDRP